MFLSKQAAHRVGRIVTAFCSGEIPEVKDLELTSDPIQVAFWSHEDFEVFGQFCKKDGDDVTIRALVSPDGEAVFWRAEYPNMHEFIEIEPSDELTKEIQ